ncbi:DNA-directed RNA polymerase subunit omega [Oscillospiraceae bacterium 50-58]
MMLYPAMKDLLEKVPSRYELVNVVACKARRIARDAEMAGEPLEEKPVSIAIQAVANGELDNRAGELERPEE